MGLGPNRKDCRQPWLYIKSIYCAEAMGLGPNRSGLQKSNNGLLKLQFVHLFGAEF